ncbi:MAG: prolipoprotein diacylglyceryl transferase [Firmicutes bacterium]|nr:prolipoprotein diacylglyceryl transferase [Bacillota bacterium]
MNPVAFEIFGVSIMWYGIFISIGVMATIIYSSLMLKREGIYNEDDFFGLIIAVIISGFIGARLYYVIFNLDLYNSFFEVFNLRQGGLAFHGGVIFGLIAIVIFTRKKKMDTLRYMDIIGIGTLLAQAVGRWGNFFNQEAHGSEVTKGFIEKFPGFIQKGMLIDGKYYHPTFLYESINGVLWFSLLTALFLLFPKLKKGTFIALAIIANSITRIIVEGLRTDSLMLGEMKVAQLVGGVAILMSLVYLLYIYTADMTQGKKKKKKK